MRIEHLQYLVEIENQHSISKAAKKLYISQTGLSSVVNSVEEELGIQIFSRTSKGVVLTQEGATALELMKEILDNHEKLHFLSADQAETPQIINLGIFPAGANAITKYLMDGYAATFKRSHLHIYEVTSENVETCLTSHVADIVVCFEAAQSFHQETLSRSGKNYVEVLGTDRFYLYVSEKSRFADRTEVELNELSEEHLLLTHAYPDPQEKSIGSVIHKFRNFSVISNLEIAKQILADSENAFMIAPGIASFGSPMVSSGKIRKIRLIGFPTELTLYMMSNVTKKLRMQETALMQEIRSFFSTNFQSV